MQRSEYIKRVIKAILFILILIVLTVILDAMFELDEHETESMLTRYSETDEIDTVFIGNSAGEMLDEKRYSDITGTSAFNMCTPSQGLSVSLKNLKLACRHHTIKTAVLLLTPDVVNSDSYDGIDHLYDRVADSASPFGTRFTNVVTRNLSASMAKDTVNTEKSVNIWIPWENETIHGFENIKDNIRKRSERLRTGNFLGSRIAFDLNSVRYETAPGELDGKDKELLSEDVSRLPSLEIDDGMIAADKLELLAKMCRFCRDNGIEFKVIVTPHRTDYFDRYASFRAYSETVSSYLDDFVSQRDFVYYNTEDDRELHNILPDGFFYDWEHVSPEYTDEATDYLADVIRSH